MLLESLETGSAWSVARGLGRNVEAHKRHLTACDQPRRNDLDGRGALSEEALAAFVEFFLGICIDQVNFMEGLVQPDRLRARIRLWAEEEIRLGKLPSKSDSIVEAILYRGELPRGEAASVVNTGERQARRIVSALSEQGGPGFGKFACALTAGISGQTGFALVAWAVPGQRRISRAASATDHPAPTMRGCRDPIQDFSGVKRTSSSATF
jgi:hypothetical protein